MSFRQRIALVALIAVACGKSPTTPGELETVTGVERFGWDQPATDAGELTTFRYAIYVDNTRTDAADVSCAAGSASGRFACTASLPQMSNGTHTLQVAAFVIDGGAVRESTRSTTVRVMKR